MYGRFWLAAFRCTSMGCFFVLFVFRLRVERRRAVADPEIHLEGIQLTATAEN